MIKSLLLRHRRSLILTTLVLIGLTLLFAPGQNKALSGSTYGRAPNGYGAWYTYMAEQGSPVQRWQKPLALFLEDQAQGDRPITLLQVGNTPTWLADEGNPELRDWIARGNRLVVLSTQGEVTAAPFSTTLETPTGNLKIETRRRHLPAANAPGEGEPDAVPDALEARPLSPSTPPMPRLGLSLPATSRLKSMPENSAMEPLQTPLPDGPEAEVAILEDEFGTLVWAIAEGKGSRIEAVTPYLGANAYQNISGNFAFLAGLVQANEAQLWVNEYSHGYRDRDRRTEDQAVRWGDYFLRTPLMLVWVQSIVLLLIAWVALNRRWGLPRPLLPPKVNNSDLYIQALSGVLRRSGNHGFVLDQWQTAERQRLQRQLGLGDRPTSLDQLYSSWEQQTGQPATVLRQLFGDSAPSHPGKLGAAHRPSAERLAQWLTTLEQLRQLSQRHLS